MSQTESPTRKELYNQLLDRRDDGYTVKYEVDGDRDMLPMFGESEEAVREEFDELTGDDIEIVAVHEA